jgi:hypothetical protein
MSLVNSNLKCTSATTGENILACIVALEAEYDTVLSQYQEAYANYVLLLTPNTSNLNRTLLEKSNSAWTPTPGAGGGTTLTIPPTITTTTPDECKSGCARTTNCSAAVFNSTATPPANKCQFYTGNGTITSDTTKTKTLYIYRTKEEAKTIVDNLQTRLQTIIDELKTKTTSTDLKNYVDNINTVYTTNKNLLRSSYDSFLINIGKIQNNLNQYNTADTEFNQQKSFVKQQHLSYRFWTIFTIIIFIIVMKMVLGIDSPSGNIMIWTTVIVLASFSLSKPSGFAMMGLILIIFMLKSFKDYFTQNQ